MRMAFQFRSFSMGRKPLFLAEEKDVELAEKSAKQWHEDEPDSEFYVIEQAGHCANMDNAVKFNDILMKLMTKK